jgi:hypothetical protein
MFLAQLQAAAEASVDTDESASGKAMESSDGEQPQIDPSQAGADPASFQGPGSDHE